MLDLSSWPSGMRVIVGRSASTKNRPGAERRGQCEGQRRCRNRAAAWTTPGPAPALPGPSARAAGARSSEHDQPDSGIEPAEIAGVGCDDLLLAAARRSRRERRRCQRFRSQPGVGRRWLRPPGPGRSRPWWAGGSAGRAGLAVFRCTPSGAADEVPGAKQGGPGAVRAARRAPGAPRSRRPMSTSWRRPHATAQISGADPSLEPAWTPPPSS